jgi:hypothetical protein
MDRKQEILWLQPMPTPTSVTVNGAKNAMDIYMQETVLEAFEFVAKNTTGHSIDEKGNVEFKYKGEWITSKQLFENFL